MDEQKLTVCEELMKIQIAFFEELGMQKIADHCVRIKMCIRDRPCAEYRPFPGWFGQLFCPANAPLCCGGIRVRLRSCLLYTSGVVPPLNLTAAYRSLWYARFGQGSSISLPKFMALHRRGSISHTGWSFDWNNPSMNYLYHRTFLCPVPYVHKVGIKGKNQKLPRLRKV